CQGEPTELYPFSNLQQSLHEQPRTFSLEIRRMLRGYSRNRGPICFSASDNANSITLHTIPIPFAPSASWRSDSPRALGSRREQVLRPKLRPLRRTQTLCAAFCAPT